MKGAYCNRRWKIYYDVSREEATGNSRARQGVGHVASPAHERRRRGTLSA